MSEIHAKMVWGLRTASGGELLWPLLFFFCGHCFSCVEGASNSPGASKIAPALVLDRKTRTATAIVREVAVVMRISAELLGDSDVSVTEATFTNNNTHEYTKGIVIILIS